PGQRPEALAVRGPAAAATADPSTRADRLAVARLEVAAGDLPAQGDMPPEPSMESIDFVVVIGFAAGFDIESIDFDIDDIPPALDGTLRPGTFAGEAATPTASTPRITATPAVAASRHGRSFSMAISAATTAIQAMLIAPRANSAAISAQQQPMHHAPCSTPIRTAPSDPSCQEETRNPSGERQRRRQAYFAGVNSYTAAAPSTATAVQRPALSQAKKSPATEAPAFSTPKPTSPAAPHTIR